MAIYESMVVYGSRLEGAEIEEQITKLRGLIEAGEGSIHSIERMGKRRLAYEIKRNQDGYYTVFHFQTEPDRIAPLQRALRLNESVIRHVVLRKEKFPEGPTVAVEEVATTSASPEPREAEGIPAEAEKAAVPAETASAAAEAPATEEAPAADEAAPEKAEASIEEATPASEEEPEAEKAEEAAPAEAEPKDEAEELEKPKEGE